MSQHWSDKEPAGKWTFGDVACMVFAFGLVVGGVGSLIAGGEHLAQWILTGKW